MLPESPANLSGISKGARMVRMRSRSHFGGALLTAAAVCTLVPASPAIARDEHRAEYRIEAGDLGEALKTISRRSGKEIIFTSEAVLGQKAPALQGTYSADEAVRALLEGSDLVAQFRKDVIIIRGRAEPLSDANGRLAENGDIVVTGSHIRGSIPSSPVISTTREGIQDRGITDLGAFARSIPQNYTGGQNPGVISSLQEGSENFNASSTMNLRGIGADATLTLLNGHRVAYDAVAQGVDISAIPLGAIERVDVVADGASALYGSDAVGGVANIVLRRDYSGLETSARVGGTTDGGNWQQQYSAVTGKTWSNGGFMLAADYNKSAAITAGQRRVTAQLFPTSIIYPPLEQISVVMAGHRKLADALSFEFDAQYSHRNTTSRYAFTRTADFTTSGNYGDRNVQTYSIAPKLLWTPKSGWNTFITGALGSSESRALTRSYSGGRETVRNHISYVNDLRSIEIGGDGQLFALPAGAAKIALGAGYRHNSLSARIRSTRGSTTSVPTNYVTDQNVYFTYGELSLPVFGPRNNHPWLKLLWFTGAVRYEHYDTFGGTATPKLGVVYEPVSGLQLSGTWGKSFKAPTLAQTSRRPTGDLLPADFFVPEAPGGRPVLFLGGAVPGLGPERATSWTTSIKLEPETINGLHIQVSYFNTRYRDRVVEPLGDGDLVFGSSIYGDLVTLSPSAAQVNALISGLPLGLTNQTGAAFDPADVGAIADNRLQNIARQALKGVDFAVSYAGNFSNDDAVEVSANASYLESTRQLSPGQPVIARAGTIFDPPHWRGSGTLTWTHQRLRLTSVLNYIGGTRDDRYNPAVHVGSFTSVDLIARLSSGDRSGILSGLGATMALSNIFNERPATIRNPSAASPTYDATNYPVTGRMISFTVSKHW